MIGFSLIFEGDGCWPDLPDKPHVIELMGDAAPHIQAAVLEGGMVSGLPSMTLRIDLPDGTVLLAETSARLFVGAGRAVAARYPDIDRALD